MRSRAIKFKGFVPNTWSCIWAKVEDPMNGVMHGYNGVDVFLQADALNTANCTVRIDDSLDGVTWTTRYTYPNDLVPGGEIGFTARHQGNYVRCMVYSTGTGKVACSVLFPNPHENPALWCEEADSYV